MDILVPGIMGLAIVFIIIFIHGLILKYFIREAVKEALNECGLSKRKTDHTW